MIAIWKTFTIIMEREKKCRLHISWNIYICSRMVGNNKQPFLDHVCQCTFQAPGLGIFWRVLLFLLFLLGRFISISRTFKIMQTAWSIDSGGGSVLKMGTKHAMYFFWFERRKKNVHTLVFIFHRSYVITADDEKTHTHRSESKKKGKE